MKTRILIRLAIVTTGVGFVFACNKSNLTNPSSTTTATELQTQSDDESQVSNESDNLTNDANLALNSSVTVTGNSASFTPGFATKTTLGMNQVEGGSITDSTNGNIICDANVEVKDSAGLRTITITYNGNNCWGDRIRTGVVVITMPVGTYWRNAGAAVTVNIENLTIKRFWDSKVIVINGTKTFTNVSGGLLVDLPNLGSITHTITGSMSILFPNGTTRVWEVAKQRVFSYNDGIVITTTGTHTDSLGNTDVAEWGTNRYGNTFESLITQPKEIDQSCEYRLVSGQNEVLTSTGFTLMITYGLDANGNPTTCPGTGTYYFKAVATNANGIERTYILPY